MTARAAANLGVSVVNGFTGSSIWPLLYSFPPVPAEMIEEGFQDFANRWNPILDVFDEVGVRFGLEVHPTEIAFDTASAERALSGTQLEEALASVNMIIAERERLRSELDACTAVERVWPSKANFLFARFRNLAVVIRCLADAGITIRVYADDSELRNCARITLASAADNDRLLRALRSLD